MLTVYRSSAGSGKTFTLVKSYIDLLLSSRGNNRHRRLLAVTFTKKATAEMKERIVRELDLLAYDGGSAYESSIMQERGWSKERLQEEAKNALTDILQDYSGFAVSTIDSFFQQIIRSFSKELGLSGSYNVELDAKQIRHMAVDDFFFGLPADSESPVIRQLLGIIEDNMEEGSRWNPREVIYGLTNELMKESYQLNSQALSELLQDPETISEYQRGLQQIRKDFFSRFYSLQKRKEQLIPSDTEDDYSQKQRRFSVFRWGKPDVIKFLKDGKGISYLVELSENPESVGKTAAAKQAAKGLQPVAVEMCRLLQGSEGKRLLNAEIILSYLPYLIILNEVQSFIERANIELNRLPISDTNRLLNSVISDGGDTPFIYDKTGNRVKHYLIDEFQDTSAMQWSNFRPLVVESCATGNGNMVVGDVKQSIYRWRNSDYTLLQNQLSREFSDYEECLLTDNWRSRRTIVEENNRLFRLLSDAMQKEYDSRCGIAEQDSAGQIRAVYSTLEQNPKKTDKSGYVRIEFLAGQKLQEREQQVLDRLPAVLDDLQSRGIRLGKVAVLVRQNKEGNLIANSLLGKGYKVVSSESMLLTCSAQVRFLIACLQLQLMPDDEVLRLKLCYEYGLTQGMSEQQSLERALQSDTDIVSRVMKYAQLPLQSQVEQLIEEFCLGDNHNTQIYVQAFQDLVYSYQSKYSADLMSFLTWWDERGSEKHIQMQHQPDAVQILTIHSSKGLEYDVVIVPFCDWETSDSDSSRRGNILWVKPEDDFFSHGGRIPLLPVKYDSGLRNSIFNDDYRHELQSLYIDNLNLTYVAFTRACKELYVFAPAAKSQTDMKTAGSALHALLRDSLTGENLYEKGAKGIEERATDVVNTMDIARRRLTEVPVKIKQRGHEFFSTEDSTDISQSVNLSQSINLGIVMHEILCKIEHRGDEDAAISEAVRDGIISREEETVVRDEMRRFWQLTADKDWFDSDYTILNEREIILPDGTVKRPDRVMIQGGKATVIDYKFGLSTREEHKQQVAEYCALLQQMGYQTEGWLCYVNKKSIIRADR